MTAFWWWKCRHSTALSTVPSLRWPSEYNSDSGFPHPGLRSAFPCTSYPKSLSFLVPLYHQAPALLGMGRVDHDKPRCVLSSKLKHTGEHVPQCTRWRSEDSPQESVLSGVSAQGIQASLLSLAPSVLTCPAVSTAPSRLCVVDF